MCRCALSVSRFASHVQSGGRFFFTHSPLPSSSSASTISRLFLLNAIYGLFFISFFFLSSVGLSLLIERQTVMRIRVCVYGCRVPHICVVVPNGLLCAVLYSARVRMRDNKIIRKLTARDIDYPECTDSECSEYGLHTLTLSLSQFGCVSHSVLSSKSYSYTEQKQWKTKQKCVQSNADRVRLCVCVCVRAVQIITETHLIYPFHFCT